MAKVQAAVKILQEASSGLDPASDVGQTVLKSIQSLAKVAPPGQAGPPGVGAEALRGLAQQAQQQSPLMALLRQQQAGGAG